MRILVLVVLFGFLLPINAQDIPDYKERIHPLLSDSTVLSQKFEQSATEGVIDPAEYKLAPGDKLFISISGIKEIPLNLVINQEGFIYIPEVGGVDLSNTTLKEGKNIIIEKINQYYKNVDIYISLIDFRKIKVSLIGDVKKPSTYIVSGNSRLSDLIRLSEGFNTTSDLRNILIKNRAGDEYKYDFLSFLRTGNKDDNPLLMEGDIVAIRKVDMTVSISGEIMYPGSYEFVEGETFDELIKLAGGFLSKAKTDSIEIVRFSADGLRQNSSYYSFSEISDKKLKLQKKDHLIIRRVPEYFEDKYVRVEGFVKYPGYYKILKDVTMLTEIIKEAGGFRSEASLNEATLYRESGSDVFDPEFERLKLLPRSDMTDDEYDYLKAKSRQRKGNVVVDFNALFNENISEEDVLLKRGDIIRIPEKRNYIILLGQVINPGNIIYKKGFSYLDYINLSGGFGWRALEGDVRIVKAKSGEWIDADEDVLLEPGDTIWIPEDPPGPKFWDVFMDTLTVLGQVAAVVAAVVAVVAVSR